MASQTKLQLPFPIIDSHHHLWEVQHPNRPKGHDGFVKDYLVFHLLRDVDSARVKLAGSVFLQGDQWGESEWCQGVADKTKNQVCTAIVGQCDLLQPYEKVEYELQQHMKVPNFRGIRFLVSNDIKKRPHTADRLDPVKYPNAYLDPVLQRNMGLFAKYNLTFDFWCYAHQLPGATALAKLHPTVNFVLDHLGTPIDIAHHPEDYPTWLKDMSELSQCQNVFAKISGLMTVLGMEAKKKMSAEALAKSVFGDMVRDTVRLFGPSRCMFGSNFPVDKSEASYETLVECYLLCFREMGLSEDDIRQIFYTTAAKFYKIMEFAPKKGKM